MTMLRVRLEGVEAKMPTSDFRQLLHLRQKPIRLTLSKTMENNAAGVCSRADEREGFD